MNILNVLFPKHKILLTPNSILFQHPEGTQIVDEKNFDTFVEKHFGNLAGFAQQYLFYYMRV